MPEMNQATQRIRRHQEELRFLSLTCPDAETVAYCERTVDLFDGFLEDPRSVGKYLYWQNKNTEGF